MSDPSSALALDADAANENVLIGTTEAARILGKSPSWVKRHVPDLQGALNPDNQTCQFSLAKILRYKEALNGTGAIETRVTLSSGELSGRVFADLEGGMTFVRLTIEYGTRYGVPVRTLRFLYEEWQWGVEQDTARRESVRKQPRCADCLVRMPHEEMSPYLCPCCFEKASVETGEDGRMRVVFQERAGRRKPTEWHAPVTDAPAPRTAQVKVSVEPPVQPEDV